MELSGKVFTGMGVGNEYLSLKPYQDKIEDITGFRPFPGTLNLRSDEDVERKLGSLECSRIESFEFEEDNYSGIDIYTGTLMGSNVAVLRMDITDYQTGVIEVVAENKLRDKLGLEDGDRVKIEL